MGFQEQVVRFMPTCESSTVTRSHIGKHYYTIDKDHLRVPLAEQGPFPARTIETLESDHASFMASSGNLKNAKHFNNAIGSAFFKIPLTQASLNMVAHRSASKHTPEALNPVRYVHIAVHEGVKLLVYRLSHQAKPDATPRSKEGDEVLF